MRMITGKSRLFAISLILAVFCFALPVSVQAGQSEAQSDDSGTPPLSLTGRFDHAIDGASFQLTDGRVVRLAGLVPARESGLDGSCHDAEVAALNGLLAGENVTLADIVPGWDTRLHAQVYRARDGLWIERALLEAGNARFYTYAEDAGQSDRDADLLKAEAQARDSKKGLWQPSAHCYRVMRASDMSHARAEDSFGVVLGKVVHVADTQSGVYLDFGEDWRHDLSILIDPASAHFFKSSDENPRDWPHDWQGRDVLVRGWVFIHIGPMIRVDHPSQIELLPDSPSGPKP